MGVGVSLRHVSESSRFFFRLVDRKKEPDHHIPAFLDGKKEGR